MQIASTHTLVSTALVTMSLTARPRQSGRGPPTWNTALQAPASLPRRPLTPFVRVTRVTLGQHEPDFMGDAQ